MRTLRHLPSATLLALALGCAPAADRTVHDVEILWDRWGVPHIYAPTEAELLYAFGWAQAHSHGNLALKLYLEARGRSAEIFGAEALASDRWVHINGVPERARRWWDLQDPVSAELIEAFAAGFNAYVGQHPDRIDQQLHEVAPITPADILAHSQRVVHFTFMSSPRALASPRAGGSNGWAIAPARTASGASLLLMNPHLPWGGPMTFYEAHLNMPGLNAHGATLVGQPVMAIAFNEHLGWTHTVNTVDGSDLYQLTADGDGYLFNGSRRMFNVRTVTLRFKDETGTLGSEQLTVRESVHGPVVNESPRGPIALRVAGLDRPHSYRQHWGMLRARNLDEFEAALRQLQLPMFTVLYADREGHILHLFGGTVPRRPDGNWNWSGVVPGDTSATLWSEYHSYDQLPRVLDPESGWLQNANDPPWTTTFPPAIDPADYPNGIAPSFMSFRAQRSARLLLSQPRLDLEEVIARKHSTRMEAADRLLDDLLPLAAAADSDLIRRAGRVLASWDRRADALSRGAPLFAAWFQGLQSAPGSTFATPWDSKRALETPDGLRSVDTALEALLTAARRIESQFGSLAVEWGDVYRLRLDDIDLPASGGPGGLGIFRVINFRPDRDGRMRAIAGDSFVGVVRFSDPIEAQALMSYGNSSQPGSPHRTDQLPLLADQKLRRLWLTREEVEANTVERKVF